MTMAAVGAGIPFGTLFEQAIAEQTQYASCSTNSKVFWRMNELAALPEFEMWGFLRFPLGSTYALSPSDFQLECETKEDLTPPQQRRYLVRRFKVLRECKAEALKLATKLCKPLGLPSDEVRFLRLGGLPHRYSPRLSTDPHRVGLLYVAVEDTRPRKLHVLQSHNPHGAPSHTSRDTQPEIDDPLCRWFVSFPEFDLHKRDDMHRFKSIRAHHDFLCRGKGNVWFFGRDTHHVLYSPEVPEQFAVFEVRSSKPVLALDLLREMRSPAVYELDFKPWIGDVFHHVFLAHPRFLMNGSDIVHRQSFPPEYRSRIAQVRYKLVLAGLSSNAMFCVRDWFDTGEGALVWDGNPISHRRPASRARDPDPHRLYILVQLCEPRPAWWWDNTRTSEMQLVIPEHCYTKEERKAAIREQAVEDFIELMQQGASATRASSIVAFKIGCSNSSVINWVRRARGDQCLKRRKPKKNPTKKKRKKRRKNNSNN